MKKTVLGFCFFLVACQSTNKFGFKEPQEQGEWGYPEKPSLVKTKRKPASNPDLNIKNRKLSGVKLADYKPFDYKLLFTDPECGPYDFEQPEPTVGGGTVLKKPDNVYCFNREDRDRSGKDESSPQFQFVKWISDKKINEVFFTYLSFSNSKVVEALCSRIKENKNFKVRFMLDKSTDTAAAEKVKACATAPEQVEYRLRGNGGAGGDEIGYAHNKIFMFFPEDKTSDEVRIVFSSGNMTSGPIVHHENFHFITTNKNSHFAHMHKCALENIWQEENGKFVTKKNIYKSMIKACRKAAVAPEEDDIKVFFIPGEGGEAEGGAKGATAYMVHGHNEFPGIRDASKIWLGAHRFFYTRMIDELQTRAAAIDKPEIQIVGDDDTFYKTVDPAYNGDTAPEEWYNMVSLANSKDINKITNIKLMETSPDAGQLHHSKYLLFADKSGEFKSVLAGAANLTGSGFFTNFENIYFVMIPDVVKQFAEHHARMFKDLATFPKDLPKSGWSCKKLKQAEKSKCKK